MCVFNMLFYVLLLTHLVCERPVPITYTGTSPACLHDSILPCHCLLQRSAIQSSPANSPQSCFYCHKPVKESAIRSSSTMFPLPCYHSLSHATTVVLTLLTNFPVYTLFLHLIPSPLLFKSSQSFPSPLLLLYC